MVSSVALYFVLPAIVLAVVTTFVRLLLGPSLPDRVVALDLMTTLGIGVIVAYALGMDEPIFVDIAIVVALISFLGTIAFAYYVQKRVQQ
ncbi:MAG: cation:proton antiporter [Chloroflexi bacterium]|nr:MAG: cation:proton antiporter [Chloroflexota bacterium]